MRIIDRVINPELICLTCEHFIEIDLDCKKGLKLIFNKKGLPSYSYKFKKYGIISYDFDIEKNFIKCYKKAK